MGDTDGNIVGADAAIEFTYGPDAAIEFMYADDAAMEFMYGDDAVIAGADAFIAGADAFIAGADAFIAGADSVIEGADAFIGDDALIESTYGTAADIGAEGALEYNELVNGDDAEFCGPEAILLSTMSILIFGTFSRPSFCGVCGRKYSL